MRKKLLILTMAIFVFTIPFLTPNTTLAAPFDPDQILEIIPVIWDEAIWNPTGTEDSSDITSRTEYYALHAAGNFPNTVQLNDINLETGVGCIIKTENQPINALFTNFTFFPEYGTMPGYTNESWDHNFIEFNGDWYSFFDIKFTGMIPDIGRTDFQIQIGDIFTSCYVDRNTQIIYDEEPAPVPEPATIFLFGIGLLSLAGIGRKKKL